MSYRTRSNSPRTITAKFAGKCFCCGGPVKVGEIADYSPATKQIGHYGALSGNSAKCYGVLRAEKYPADYIDIDRAYEDQCADICGR